MIDQDANNYADQMDVECRTRWKNMDDKGETSTLERLQGLGKRSLDQSNVGKRIEYLYNFDMDEVEHSSRTMMVCRRDLGSI